MGTVTLQQGGAKGGRATERLEASGPGESLKGEREVGLRQPCNQEWTL